MHPLVVILLLGGLDEPVEEVVGEQRLRQLPQVVLHRARQCLGLPGLRVGDVGRCLLRIDGLGGEKIY